MQRLIDMLRENQKFLIRRVLEYAKIHDFTRYTSTLEEAWIASIDGLSEALIAGILHDPAVPEIKVDNDFSTNPIATFGLLEAKRHRSRGVTLQMFMGLMKYYRQAYLDLVTELVHEHEQKGLFMLWINRFFDHNEISFCCEWMSNSKDALLLELQETNKILTNEKNKYLTIFESMPNAAIILDGEHNCININYEAQQLLFSGEESPGHMYYSNLLGKVKLEKVFPEIYDRYIDFFDQNIGEEKLEKEFESATKGKINLDIKFSKMLDISGKFQGNVILLDDITERKTAEEINTLIVETTTDAFVLYDTYGNLMQANESMCKMFGYSKDELTKLSIHDLTYIREDNKVFEDKIEKIKREGSALFETKYKRKNGEVFYVEISVTYMPTNNYFCAFMRDVTQKKFAEEELLQAKNQAETANILKSRFLATTSHEIRTPLNAILGMAQLLRIQNIDKEKRDEYVQIIYNSGQTLLTVLNDILDLSRIEAGHVELESIIFDPKKIIQEISTLFYEKITSKGLKVQVFWNGSEDKQYKGDPTRIRQMLTNFVSNAMKFTEQGVICIEGREVSCIGEKAMLEFSVSDTGGGISKNKLDRLFKPFSQVDSSIARKHGGSGLGLSIVAGLAKLMGGDVGVESKIGEGSRFWFNVLTNNLTEEEVGFQKHDSTANFWYKNRRFVGHHILVVEDDDINREVIKAMLENLGIIFESASNGQDAIKRITSGEIPDLVLMDCQMPVMDGYTATQNIRLWEEKNLKGRMPIIALTANAFSEDKSRCFAAGMDDFLSKPIVMTNLVKLLENWMDFTAYK